MRHGWQVTSGISGRDLSPDESGRSEKGSVNSAKRTTFPWNTPSPAATVELLAFLEQRLVAYADPVSAGSENRPRVGESNPAILR